MTLRILNIIQRYPPAHGGSEAYFQRLSQWLARRGHHVTVWTTAARDLSAFWQPGYATFPIGMEQDGEVLVRRFGLQYIPARRYILKALSSLPIAAWQARTLPATPRCPTMAKAVKKHNECDAVHATAFPYTHPIYCGWKLARRLDVPFLLTPFIHIGPWNEPENRLKRAYLARPMRWLLRQADRVFAQTESEREAIIATGVEPKRVLLQGMGVNPSDVLGGNRAAARAAWGVTDQDVVIGHLANQSREKGTIHLMEAGLLLKRRKVAFKIVLAGTQMPGAQAYLKDYSAPECYVQQGELTDAQRRDFFAGIDLFCLPSISDSFGLVLLEAWENGVPSVGIRAGGIGDVIQHGRNGLLVESQSHRYAKPLADALQELIENPVKRRDFGEVGRRHCEQSYRWADKLELVERETYKAIAERRR
jgi:glycosyltransferase involved in cell wall biosynthesis